MSDDPIDDYLQALIGQALPEPAQDAAHTPCPASTAAAPAASATAAAICGPADGLLAELDAAFDQARDSYQQAQAASTPAPGNPADDLLAELDAAFDQARDSYQQAQAASTPAPGNPADDLLAELDAAFDQARQQFESGQAAPSTAAAAGGQDDAALQALFDAEQARYQQAALPPAVPAVNLRRIPPAPIGPPVLAISGNTAQPIWQASGSSGQAAGQEPRRRASERASRWLRLRCDQQPYALELLKVQEVVLLAPLLYLRGAPPHMLGIMNLRGQVVPVMDLGLYLGGEAARITPATRIVVLESEGQSLGLRVSAVDDVTSLTQSQIEPPDTARLCRFSNHLFRGVARLSGPPIILLDANALLN